MIFSEYHTYLFVQFYFSNIKLYKSMPRLLASKACDNCWTSKEGPLSIKHKKRRFSLKMSENGVFYALY
jgi:hypothetical protein